MGTRATYIRIPDELHLDLRLGAAREDVSLNQYITTLLLEASEARRASVPTPERSQ